MPLLVAGSLSPLMAAMVAIGGVGLVVSTYYALLYLARRAPWSRPARATALAGADHGAPALAPTSTGVPHIKVFWWAFLASDCMFFGSLISAYLVYKGRGAVGPYPLEVFDFTTTSISTFILLMSSTMMVLALAAIQRGELGRFRLWCGLTAVLGIIFLGFQVYEFSHFYHLGLTMQSSLFGSTFYTLTGTHGLHVLIGVIWLVSMFINSYWGGITKERAMDVEIAGLYWHFVDIVWIVIFGVIYLMELTP